MSGEEIVRTIREVGGARVALGDRDFVRRSNNLIYEVVGVNLKDDGYLVKMEGKIVELPFSETHVAQPVFNPYGATTIALSCRDCSYCSDTMWVSRGDIGQILGTHCDVCQAREERWPGLTLEEIGLAERIEEELDSTEEDREFITAWIAGLKPYIEEMHDLMQVIVDWLKLSIEHDYDSYEVLKHARGIYEEQKERRPKER